MYRILLVLLASHVCLRAGACVPLSGEQLRAGDLAKGDAAFAALPADLVLSYAPPPGRQRTISATELKQWRVGHQLSSEGPETICFERTAEEIAIGPVTEAMLSVSKLKDRHPKLNVLEVCRCSVPNGQLEFRLSGLSPAPAGRPETPVLWRGVVKTATGQAYPVWAKVILSVEGPAVRATHNLKPGQTIQDSDLESIVLTESPLRLSGVESVDFYAGKAVRQSVAAGAILGSQLVVVPSAVKRGTLITVDVLNDGADLSLQARAEADGNKGDQIQLTNLSGFRRFTATVVGPNRAEIQLGHRRIAGDLENKQGYAVTSNKRSL